MKFLCGSCNRLMDVEKFRVDGGVLVISCTSCGGESRSAALAPVAAPPAPKVSPAVSNVTALRTPTVEAIARAERAASLPDPFEVPEGHCPKCISKRAATALACPSCGLVFAQAQTNAFNPSDWLKSEWVQLLAAWGEDKRHEALRSAAMNQGELAELGRLYRLRLADQPLDPYAQRGRDEVLRLAVLPSVSMRQMKAQPGAVPTWKYVALSAVIAGCLLALFLLVRQMLTLS